MKIAIVSYEFPPHNGTGGVAFYSYNLAKLLSYNHQVVVFSGDDLETDAKYLENNSEGFISVVINSKDSQSFIYDVVSVFEKYHLKNQFEIIESPEVGACALKIKEKYNNINLVVKLHTPIALLGLYTLKNLSLKFKCRWYIKSLLSFGKVTSKNFFIPLKWSQKEYRIIQLANSIYSPSYALSIELSNLWQLDRSIIRIPNYYPINSLQSKLILKSKYQSITQKIEISFIGKLTFLKGADLLFELISDLLETEIDFHINIIGNDEGDLSGRKYCNKFSHFITHSRVSYLTRIQNEEVLEILARTHILLVPSLWENQPTIIFEGIANACLVLANNIGGINEQLTEFGDGFLINQNKKGKYLNLIFEIYRDKELYFKKVLSAIDKMSSTFNAKRFLDTQVKFYNESFENNSYS